MIGRSELICRAFATAVGLVYFCALTHLAGNLCAQPPSPTIDEVAPDLPLPASPPLDAAWLRQANIIQPYGHSAFVFLTDPDRPARLKREFGFNVTIVQPTDSHNTIAHPQDQLTDEQFRAGLARCREAGYRILLYTSVMAMGLTPEFQSGEIAAKHPDWLQRDAAGNHVMVWGVPWLCPNSGAREAALERCLRIVREYDADGVMLDNNQFFKTEAGGWTCHCDACTRKFREYLKSRFGDEEAANLFGKATADLSIPIERGPLHAIWLHWRNRVWAEINETFRARLRLQDPDVMLFANTQYKFDDAMLASDLQYEREDVVLSESVGLNSQHVSEKLTLGHGLAAGRPLFNYIGTFSKFDDYTGLLPPDVISPMIAATLAHNARPWIVDGFDEGPTDANSRAEMRKLLRWHADHPALFDKSRASEVASLISTVSRDLVRKPLIPPHIGLLQSAGIPVVALRDDRLTLDQLRPFQIIVAETSACLSAASAETLAKWVRAGGTLLAAQDTGTHNELGQLLPRATLWHRLGLRGAPDTKLKVGEGTVFSPAADKLAATAHEVTREFGFLVDAATGVEVVAYRDPSILLLHVLRQKPLTQPVAIRLPSRFMPTSATAKWYVPGEKTPLSLELEHRDGRTRFFLGHEPLYSVVEIPLR